MGCNGGVPSTAYTYYRLNGIVDGGNYGDKSMCYSYQLKPCAHHSTSTKYANCTDEVPTPKCARKCVDDGGSGVLASTAAQVATACASRAVTCHAQKLCS